MRCDSTGHAWVGASRDLNAARNGLWFMLRTGSNRNAELQAEWKSTGNSASASTCSRNSTRRLAFLVNDLLEEKMREHAAREQARTLLP